MTIAYSIIFVLSLILPISYFIGAQKKKEFWLFMMFLCVCIVNFGYLLLSVAPNVAFALTANKIAYLGQVFIIMCMFMIISRLCGFSYPKWFIYLLTAIAILMYAVILTTGHLDWYYKSVTLTTVDGAPKLVKEYGILHSVYLVYILSYFAAMLAVICISLKRSTGTSQKTAGLMLIVVLGNIGMWLVEKIVTWNFQFLSVSYLMSEFVMFFVYWLLEDYIHKNEIPSPVIVEEKVPIIVVDSLSKAEKLKVILSSLPENISLSARQTEIVEKILEGKSRKEIAADLCLSENTVKTHTGMLYRSLGVSSRDEIYAMFQK